jgi:hypothetical protein
MPLPAVMHRHHTSCLPSSLEHVTVVDATNPGILSCEADTAQARRATCSATSS